MHSFICESGLVVGTPVKLADIERILDMSVYDAKIEELRDAHAGRGDEIMYKAVSLPSSLLEPLLARGLSQQGAPQDWGLHAWQLAHSELTWGEQLEVLRDAQL